MLRFYLSSILLWFPLVSHAGGATLTGSVSEATTVNGSENMVNSGNNYKTSIPPYIAAPSLTTSNDTCAESFTTGGVGAGFGLTFGKTYVSKPCNTRYNANQMTALGKADIAIEMMCAMDDIYEADLRLAKHKDIDPVCVPRDSSHQNNASEVITLSNDAPVLPKYNEELYR